MIQSYVQKLINLVELEKQAEIESAREEIKRLSGKKREKLGRAILGLNGKIIGEEFGYKLVKYGREKKIKTEISVGDLVLISKKNPLKSNLTGVVAQKGKRFIVVALDEVPSWALKNVRIDLFVNEITFKRMIVNLEKLNDRCRRALEFALGIKKPKISKEEKFTPFDKELNESQIEAISLALGSEDFFLIQGPFGTGKTRTLAELILQEVKRGNRVLATAESNVAVDNLVERLANKANVVRIGHPTRVSKHLITTTLAYKVTQHKMYKKVTRLRKRVDKLISQRDLELKPTPQLRRGLSDKEIFKLARIGKGARGLSKGKIRSMARWLRLNKKVDSLLRKARRIEDEIAKEIISNADVVLTTNSTAALEIIGDYDVVVIDEATQAIIPSILIPIAKANRFILAGDHKQLPPTILSYEAKELVETLFEKLIKKYPYKSKLLEIQYRMNEKLMEFPNEVFYGGKLKTYEKVAKISIRDLISVQNMDFGRWNAVISETPIVFIDTSAREDKYERQRPGSTSRENLLEAKIVKKVVEILLNAGIKKEWLGIITPYDDQVDLIRSVLDGDDIEVNSVDAYQGREKEIIVISFVRSNKAKELGFLEDLRRLNVSLTRARRKLIAIGDAETLSANEIYRKFIEFVKKNGEIIKL